MRMRRKGGGLFTGMLLGGLIGATVGVLFAPDKGEKTREKLAKKGKDVYDDVEKNVMSFKKKEIDPRFKEMKKDFAEVSDKIKEKRLSGAKTGKKS